MIIEDGAGLFSEKVITVNIIDDEEPVIIIVFMNEVLINEVLMFDASTSYDNHQISEYKWIIFDNDIEIEKTGPYCNYSFKQGGIFTVQLEIKDHSGNVNQKIVTISVIDYGFLIGSIVGPNNNYIDNITIEIENNGILKKYYTDNYGRYNITINSGFYKWKITARGYISLEGEGIIEAGEIGHFKEQILTLDKKEKYNPFVRFILPVFIISIILISIIIFIYIRNKRNKKEEIKYIETNEQNKMNLLNNINETTHQELPPYQNEDNIFE